MNEEGAGREDESDEGGSETQPYTHPPYTHDHAGAYESIESAEDEHLRVGRMLQETSEDGGRRILVWNPMPQVAFGRRDMREEGYEIAVAAAEDRGLTPTRRTAGGRAVVHAGGTVAFATTEVADAREDIRERYCRVSDAVEEALTSLDVEVECREPEASFCPGDHSLSTGDGKVVGVAQRVSDGAALVSGVVLVRGLETTVEALEEVYAALGLELDRRAVSTLEESRPDVTVEEVMDAIDEKLPCEPP